VLVWPCLRPASALVQAPPQRIISLIPAVTEMLFAIGAGDRVVGVSTFDHYPAEAEQRANVGGLVDPNFERILSLRPDLVVVYGTQGDLISRLNQVHVPMFNYQHAGLADITVTLRAIGERVGRREAAETLAARIEAAIAETRARVAGRPRPRAMIVFDREAGSLQGMYASGGVGFLHDMLGVAGGVNVFADVPRQSIQVSSELALARAPDVIMELHWGDAWTPDHIAREQAVWQKLPSLPAVRTGRITMLIGDKWSVPGPRVVESIQAMAKALHPELF
jgi:iron complex transport system substrate-binding protein